MEPSKKYISSEDLKRLNLISKILKLQNSQQLNTCREDLQLNGYLPDIDAEQSSMFEVENLEESEDSVDYYQKLLSHGSLCSLHQPLELLVNTLTNSLLPTTKVKSCSGRASTSSVKNNSNSGRTTSLGTAPIRTKPPTAGSVAGRASLSTEEKQAKRSGVGFFHRTNDRFYSRSSGFESSSGSDETSSSTAGDETDDEVILQRNRQNRSQSTKRMQPITYMSRASQGRKNTVRNGSLPNRPTQKEITSRTSANSINKSLQKPSSSLNSLTTKPRSTSTSKINSQRKGTPIFNPVQTTTMRASSTNLGANKTSGKVSVQKAQNAEKAPQREKPSTTKNILLNENVQQAREKEIATLGIAPTLNRIISTPYGRSEPQNYTTEERTNECQEALTLAKNAGGEKEKTQSCFSDTNKKEHSQRNQSKEMEPSVQNKGNENNVFMPTATTDGNMNNFVNPALNNPNSYSQNAIPLTFIHRLTPEEEQRPLFEDAAEVLKQHAYPSETHNNQGVSPVSTHNQVNEHQNSNYYLNQRSHVEEFSANPVALNAVNQHEQYRQTYQQDNISQRPNSQLRMHPSHIQSLQQQQHQQSPPQMFSQSTSQVQSGYPQQIHQRLQHQSPPQIFSQSTSQVQSGYHQQIQQHQHQQSPPQMFLHSASQDNSAFSQQNQQQSQHLMLQQQHYSPPQHLSQPSSQENRGFHHQYQQQQSQTPGYQQQQQHYESPPQHLSQPTSLDNRGYHQQQLMVGTSPSFQQVSPPQQQRFKPPSMYPPTTYDNVSTTMPPAVPLSSSQTYSNQNFHTFQQQSNISTRPHLPQNWINHSPSDYHVSTISGVPPEILQNSSNSNAISLNHHSPQIFNQQSPQHRPPQRRSNPSASIQHHRQQSYSSPSETQNYINSPATPMSNPRPSPLPPPYPQNNGQSNFSNGLLSSANIANVNSTLLQEQRIHQQRIWEQQKLHHQQQQQQQQQQIMMQQIPWQQQGQQFRSPQHSHQVPSGPGMYSVPPNRYGYPTPTVIPTIPETPTKSAIPETPPKATKASTKKKTPELNRLLNAPPDRLPIVQHPMQSVRPQMFQQHYQTTAQPISRPVMTRLPHQGFAVTNPQINQQQQQANPNNLQQQYYMIPANQPQTMQMVSLQQQYIGPHQPLPSSSQQQPLHFSQTGTLPQHVQFQQLNILSPQQIRQPMSQPENVTMSPQQQNHFPQFAPQQQQRTSQIYLQQSSVQHQNTQNQPQQQQQYIQPKYSNPASEPLSANVISSKLNSPYSNGPNSLTPNTMPPNFYSSNHMPTNGSPDNFEFSPTNPKLPNRLTTFNTTLICNPNGALSPFTSPSNITTVTPSPPKTPQLKRPYNTQSSNNDGNGDISKKKKDSSSTFIPVTTSSSHSYSIPPSISSFQVQPQASNFFITSTTDNPAQNLSYTTSSNQQQTHPQKKYYPEESPIPGAEKYYATLRANQAKDAFVNEVSTQNLAPHIPNMTYESTSLNPSNDSNIAADVEMITPTNPEEIIFSEQNAQFDDFDPLEEFMDPEVVNETAPSFSMPRQNSEAFESGEINEIVIEASYETNVVAESNSQTEEVPKLSLIPESTEVNVNAEQNVCQNGESNRDFVGTNYVTDVAAENSPQMQEVFEEAVNPNSEKREVAPSEDPEVEKQQEIETNINNEEELEEGEIVESDEETAVVEIENKKEKTIKRSREFETDEMPIVEEKRPKISTELNNVAPLNVLGNELQKETEELLLVSESSAQNVDEIVEEGQGFEDISDEEGLLADSPIKDTVDILTDCANHERDESEALVNATSVENVSQTSKSIEVNNEELLLADFRKPDSVTREVDQNIENQEFVYAIVEDIGPSASKNIVENNEILFSSPKISEINANSVENVNETIDEESLLSDCKVTDSIEINSDRNAEKLDEFEESVNAIMEENVSSHTASMNAEEADEGLFSSRKLSENNVNSVKNISETNDESQRFQSRETSAEKLLPSDSPLKDVVSTPADLSTEEISQSVTLSANVEEDSSHPTASNDKKVNGEELLLNGLQINDEISITADCNIDEFSETAITAKNAEEIDEEALLADSPKKDTAEIDANCNIQELNESEKLDAINNDIVSPPAAFKTIEANDEEMLLADSPELQTSLSTVMNNLKESEDSSQSSIDAVKSIMNSEIENDKAIDEEILSGENPIEAHSNLDVEILELNQGVNEIVLDESNNDIEMAELTDDENDTAPSYEELLQSCGEEINTENSEEMLSKFGANAAMNAATEICTLNVIRNEVHKVITDISATSSIEKTVMVNLVQDIFNLQLEEVKKKNLAVINVSDKQSQKLVQKYNLKPGRRYEGAVYEIMIPLYTAAIKWEKEENKSPEFYENIKYVKKLLLSMVANLGKSDDTNLWHELFTLQIFSTPQRVKILYQLLTKSINICNFLNDFIALVIDLFSITQCAACLFIKDFNDLKKIDSNVALVVIEAVNRVRDLTPEMRSQLVFKFQIRIYQFLEKFEHSNISPEAHAFVSSLSWDAKTLSDSRDLPKGYLPISEPMNPSVEKIFKKSLKRLNKSGVIKVKGWSYNFAKSVLQSNFMTTIIRDSENLEKKVQEAFLAEIIPTILKLALSLPHLFVASDPYHQLELIPTLFEDSAPILNKATEDIHEQMIVPFMPFATIMESIKRHNSPSTESLLKSCHRLFVTLKNAPNNIPEAIQAERRRCSNKLLYEKIHREYVRRQMAKSDIEKFQNDEDKLDLKHLHSMASKLFTTKSLEVPPKIIAGIKEGDREAVSTEKVFRSKMMDSCCNVLKTILDAITIEQKLEFMIDHPLLNEKLNVADILNVHQFGKDPLGCFTAFIGLLSLPNNKILGDPKSSTFFNAIKQRRNAIFYFALKNSAFIKNNRPTVSPEILEKDIPIYDILMKIFLTADMKRNLCCPDNVSTYLYFALIINDISNVDIEIASEHLFEECGINENQVPFFATFNYANDLEAKIEKLFNDELETLVKDISSRVSFAGIPRIIYEQLRNCQTKINELKCLVIQLVSTFWNPQKLLYAVGITLECRKKLEIGIEEIGKLLITGFYHMGKRTIKVEDLEAMILEEMDHIRGECLMSFQNSSLYGLILHIQQLFGFDSVISAILIVLYAFTITNEKQIYAHRISLAFQISRESNLLKIFGLKNSEICSTGIQSKKNQVVVELEKLFEEDYILHAAEVDPSIFFVFLDKPLNIQYKELMFALESECNGIKNRFQFHVNKQRLRYHPKNVILREPASDTPLIGKFPKNMFFKSTTKEVPANFYYPGEKTLENLQ